MDRRFDIEGKIVMSPRKGRGRKEWLVKQP